MSGIYVYILRPIIATVDVVSKGGSNVAVAHHPFYFTLDQFSPRSAHTPSKYTTYPVVPSGRSCCSVTYFFAMINCIAHAVLLLQSLDEQGKLSYFTALRRVEELEDSDGKSLVNSRVIACYTYLTTYFDNVIAKALGYIISNLIHILHPSK